MSKLAANNPSGLSRLLGCGFHSFQFGLGSFFFLWPHPRRLLTGTLSCLETAFVLTMLSLMFLFLIFSYSTPIHSISVCSRCCPNSWSSIDLWPLLRFINNCVQAILEALYRRSSSLTASLSYGMANQRHVASHDERALNFNNVLW